jgi:hypothetical protein
MLCCRPTIINSAAASKHGGRSESAGQGSPSAATVTLLAVSFYLIFTTLPVTVCYVLYLGFPEGDSSLSINEQSMDPTWIRHHVYRAVRTTVEELAMSKYACNFYIYLMTGIAFRCELRRLIASATGRCCISFDVVGVGNSATPSSFSVSGDGPRYMDLRGRQTVAGYTDGREQLMKASALWFNFIWLDEYLIVEYILTVVKLSHHLLWNSI